MRGLARVGNVQIEGVCRRWGLRSKRGLARVGNVLGCAGMFAGDEAKLGRRCAGDVNH